MNQTLRLQLLGSPQIYLDEVPVSAITIGKAQALLYYLSVTGRPHPRASLATLLWAETSDRQARKNLRKLLTHLRPTIGPYLTITREAVAISDAKAHWLDVDLLRMALATESAPMDVALLERATTLYRGEFLDGFGIRNAPIFEEWMLTERAHYHELTVRALTLLAQHYLAEEEYEAGLASTRRLLTLEPWREVAHQQQMCLLASMGDRTAALTQYETCRTILAAEFGVDPMPETQELYEQIKAGSGNGVTRWQGDKVTGRQKPVLSQKKVDKMTTGQQANGRAGIVPSPCHRIALSPHRPVTSSQPPSPTQPTDWAAWTICL
ncbi:hypothetical protein KFU94_68545 [Chloroflexi bacterium TSY]|nr:hypothetical protein [Chloroflexi bacterium TSY]